MQRPDIFTGLRRPPKNLLLCEPPGRLTPVNLGNQQWSLSMKSILVFNEDESTWRIKTSFLVQIVSLSLIILQASLSFRSRTVLVRKAKNVFFSLVLPIGKRIISALFFISRFRPRSQEWDSAARRHLVKRIYIPLSDLAARQSIISNLLQDQKHALSTDDIEHACTLTDGFSGADMRSLCHDTALEPIRDIHGIELHSIDQVWPKNYWKPFVQVCRKVISNNTKTYCLEQAWRISLLTFHSKFRLE